LPAPKKADPNAAAALQELLGGKYGEMSTLGNYFFQSFNFRSKSKLRPFYSLVSLTLNTTTLSARLSCRLTRAPLISRKTSSKPSMTG
jgi:hypothetical protein